VLQILPQRIVVELRQELRLRGGVVMTDVVDQLTFAHDGFTFATRGIQILVIGPIRGRACMNRVWLAQNLKQILPVDE
jgi:hypothetical protein